MLQVKHLTMTHRQDLRELLSDFSLVLNAGDKAVLIGEEGNGKSTLLKWIYDPALIEPYVEAEGERVWDGRMAYLPQELPPAERALTVYDFFSAAEAFWKPTTASCGSLRARCGSTASSSTASSAWTASPAARG